MSVACAVLTILSLPYMHTYMYTHFFVAYHPRKDGVYSHVLPAGSWIHRNQYRWCVGLRYVCMYSAVSSSHSPSLSPGCAWSLGSWETMTYGLFGMYKSDWLEHGGFNIQRYTNKWGGEDWDVLDRYCTYAMLPLFLLYSK